MALSSNNLNEIGDLYENIVSSNVEQLDEYAAGGTGPTAATLQKQKQAQKSKTKPSGSIPPGVTAKVGPVTVGVTDPKADIGRRVGQGIVGALRDLPGGLAAQIQGKDSPELQRQRSRYQKLGQLATTGRVPVTSVPRTPENLKDPEFRRSGGWTGDPNAGRTTPSGSGGTRPPVAKPPAARPPVTAKQTPARPAAPAQTGDRTKDLTTWAKANQSMISKVGTPQQRAILSAAKSGSAMPAPKPISSDIGDIKGAIKRSQERQAAQSGPMYSSPDVKSKMSTRTKTVLGLKDSYDIVLDYLLSQGHVDTLEEALYVMMEMDAENIKGIVEGVMPEPINPDAHKDAQRLARQQGRIRALEAGASTPGEQSAAKSKLRGPQLPGV